MDSADRDELSRLCAVTAQLHDLTGIVRRRIEALRDRLLPPSASVTTSGTQDDAPGVPDPDVAGRQRIEPSTRSARPAQPVAPVSAEVGTGSRLAVSDQQRALLRRLSEEGCSASAMLPKLNALPGCHFRDATQVDNFRRRSGLPAKARAPAVAAMPAAPPPAAATRTAPAASVASAASASAASRAAVEADFETVARWAAQRGISVRRLDDVEAANAKRVSLGLPPFRLPPTPARAAMAG